MKEEQVKRFEDLLKSTNRNGIDKLLEFIRKSDFYTAPASTIFHGNYEGGLLDHSLNVYDCLIAKKNEKVWVQPLENVTEENIIISALLHDLCKTYYYKVDTKNQKIDGEWKQVPYYRVEDKIPYGHGEKSVMMIEEYIKLQPVERYAIRWHMGAYEPKELWNTLGLAMGKYPLVLAIHQADMEATYILESGKE